MYFLSIEIINERKKQSIHNRIISFLLLATKIEVRGERPSNDIHIIEKAII